jgi:CopG family transcriptional regulator, nickel-responsive regulator
MSEIVRFSVSLEDDLLEQFDRFCEQEHYATRSEAIRQLLRDTLTKEAWAGESKDAAGTLTLVYDHHRPQLRDHLTKLQHDNNDLVVSTLHAHLTHDLCLEVIVLRGPSSDLQKIASQLRGLKGIFKGELVMASAEQCFVSTDMAQN